MTYYNTCPPFNQVIPKKKKKGNLCVENRKECPKGLLCFRFCIHSAFTYLPKAGEHHSAREITAKSRYHRAAVCALLEADRKAFIYKNPADRSLRDHAYSLPFESPAAPCAVLRIFALSFISKGDALLFPRHICTEVRNLEGASLIRDGKL